jgi:oligosaccharide repeat unit polymerase
MLFKFIVGIAILFPLVGIWLMEGGAYGGSVGQRGYPNGATWAYLIYYVAVAFFTMRTLQRTGTFRDAGKRRKPYSLRHPWKINFWCTLIMGAMLAFLLYGLGGINNYYGLTNSGTFRASLTGFSAAIGSIILKYIAPAMFAFVLMTNVAWNPKLVRSGAVLMLSVVMMLISGSYGFKSSFVLALLPAGILYCWRSSPLVLAPLGFVAMCFILFGYMFFASSASIGVALGQMTDRLFVLQGDVPWLMWTRYADGGPFPSYSDTLLPVAGDRIFSFLTGITAADERAWIMSHFGSMITSLSGFSDEVIMGGHSNTGTVFSEGLIAGGIFGVVIFAVFAGGLVNWLYNFIDNKLKANDFASAAVAAAYFVNAVMAWLLSGGIQAAVHISMLVLIPLTYIILDVVRGSPNRRKSATTVPAS